MKGRIPVLIIDDRIVKKIKNYSDYKKDIERKSNPLREENGQGYIPSLPPLQEVETYSKPTALLDENSQPGAPCPFEFHSPVKEKRFAILSSPGRPPKSPRTPQSSRNRKPPRTPTTPARTPKGSKRDSKSITPRRVGRPSSVPETPQSFRRSVRNRIQKIVHDEDSSSSDEDCEDDSDVDKSFRPDGGTSSESDFEADGAENHLVTPLKGFSKGSASPLRTPRGRKKQKIDLDMVGSNDAYFLHSNACVTSDHMLSRLEVPRLAPDVLRTLLDSYETHPNERSDLEEEHYSLFHHWITLLCQGFSLFLCGIGSKKKLLSRFQREILSDIDHVVINGFFPSLTMKSILTTIVDDILCLSNCPVSICDQLYIIEDTLSTWTQPLFIIIHNLDGPMIRSYKAQRVLSKLAHIKNIHLIASLDHINAPLIFDSSALSLYNPLWWDTTTMAPYTEETSYENSLLVQQTGALALSSLIHVFKSLTPNAKGIFLLLANHQVDQRDNSNYVGLSFGDLYQKCREQFLINSDLTLRAQLTEFRDHKLVRTKKGYDGVENLIIPLDADTITNFVQQHEEEQ